MDERIVKFRVGVMVLATLIITGILVLLFGNVPKFATTHYRLYIHFDEAPGVSKDTPVRKSGVLIGRVNEVRLLDGPGERGGALVSLDIDAERRLHGNEFCKIESTLLGDSTLVWMPLPDKNLAREVIEPNTPDTPLEGRVATNPLRMASDMEGRMTDLMDSAMQASRDISELSRRLTVLVDDNEGAVQRVVTRAEQTLDSVKTAADSVGDVLGDPQLKQAIKTSLADVPDVMNELRGAITSMKHTMELADRNLENLEGITEPLGQKGASIVGKVDNTLSQVEKLVIRLNDFSESLNSSDGTLGRLINDPELYENLNSATANINQLTRDIKPIIKDVRIFTDRIARHPETIGVGGAIRRSTGAKN
ncbi:MAG: MlaD family protein [Pirellulales bacterium]